MMIIWLILQRLSWKIVMGRLVINMSGFNSSFYWMSLTTFLHTSTTVKNFITNTWSPMRWMRCLDNCKMCLRKKIVFWGKKILKDANIYPGNGFFCMSQPLWGLVGLTSCASSFSGYYLLNFAQGFETLFSTGGHNSLFVQLIAF